MNAKLRLTTTLVLMLLLASAIVFAQEIRTLSTTDQQYQNFVINGNFEYWSGGKPLPWNDITGAVPTYAQDSIKRLGSYSLKITTQAGTTSQGTYQRITIEPNTTYTFSCYYYSLAGNQAELEIDGSATADLVNKTGVDAPSSTSGTWKRFAASFTTAAADTYIDIKLYAKADESGNKSAYFDAITLTQGPLTVAFSPTLITEQGGETIYGDLTLKGDVTIEGGEVKISGLSAAPGSPSTGTVYFNTTNSKLYVYNGTSWLDLTVQGISYAAGNDLDMDGVTFNIEPQLDYVTTISRDGGDLTLETTTSGNIILSPAGRVGIGTTEPSASAALDVSGDIITSGTITQSRTIYLIPNYENALIRPDGGTNRGTLKTSYSTGRSYYEWTTNEPVAQDCDIILRIKLPDGFSSFDSTSPIVVYNKVSDDSGDTAVDVVMYDTSNAEIQLKDTSDVNLGSLQNTAWGSGTTIKLGNLKAGGTPTYTAGGWVTLIFKLTADQNDTVDLGELSLKGNW